MSPIQPVRSVTPQSVCTGKALGQRCDRVGERAAAARRMTAHLAKILAVEAKEPVVLNESYRRNDRDTTE